MDLENVGETVVLLPLDFGLGVCVLTASVCLVSVSWGGVGTFGSEPEASKIAELSESSWRCSVDEELGRGESFGEP